MKKIYRRYFLIFMALAVAPVFTGCGKDSGSASDDYTVSLEMPVEAYDARMGVTHQELRVEGKNGDVSTFNWSSGTRERISFDEGSTLTYSAYGNSGILLLTGSVRVGPEKRVTIPLRRVQ